ncbi:MAG: hypothetical protein O7E57_05550 [Gammaproteobacteria bacterium]|nr:hypothetical protein [Gammaproteobacteria bacterium]
MAGNSEVRWKYWQLGGLALALALSGYTVLDKWREQLRFYPGPGDISFNQGSIQGWTMDGLYDGDTNNKISIWNFPPFWLDNTDFSSRPMLDPLGDNKGSIMFPMGPGIPQSSSKKWRVDLISPDLSGDTNWQDIKGISAAVCDRASFTGLTPIEVRFFLRMKKSDGTVYLLGEKTNAPHQTSSTLVWDWNYLTANLAVPKGETTLNLIVKMYGTAFPQAYSTGFIALDAVSSFQ